MFRRSPRHGPAARGPALCPRRPVNTPRSSAVALRTALLVVPAIPALAPSPAAQDAPPPAPCRERASCCAPVLSAEDPLDQARLDAFARGIAAELEALRELEFETEIPVSLVTQAAFAEHARARLLRSTPLEEMRTEELAAKLLGLIPPDMDLVGSALEVMQEQVGGFYDHHEQRVFVVEGLNAGFAQTVLASELNLALDDQHFDVVTLLETASTSTDASLALNAVYLGSATAAMNQWIAGALDDRRVALVDLESAPGMGSEALAVAPEYIWKPTMFLHLRGPAFLVRSENVLRGFHGEPTPSDIRRAYTDPPRSTEQVLHPEKYWNRREREAPLPVEFGSEIPTGWRVLRDDVLGELLLAQVATAPDARDRLDLENPLGPLTIEYTSAPATGWGGDRALLLGRGEGRVLVSVSRWDDEDEAAEFLAAAEQVQPHVEEGNLRLCVERNPERTGSCLSGCRVHRGDARDEVVIASWVGVSRNDLDALLAAVRWSGEEIEAMHGREY